MARYKTLISLLDDLRAETRNSLNPAHNAQNRDIQVKQIQRMQEWLWEDFRWPHLRVRRDVPLQAGQRFYDVPSDLDIDRIEFIEIRFNGLWVKLEPTIEAIDYLAFDSDLDRRGWPVRRWRIYEEEQIEVHPIPDLDQDPTTLEGTLRFTGIRKLNPLVADTDRADLDSRLIVLYAAAEALAAAGAKDAQSKVTQANKLYGKLRGGLMPRRRFKMFGTAEEPKSPLRGPPTVYYRTTS